MFMQFHLMQYFCLNMLKISFLCHFMIIIVNSDNYQTFNHCGKVITSLL